MYGGGGGGDQEINMGEGDHGINTCVWGMGTKELIHVYGGGGIKELIHE